VPTFKILYRNLVFLHSKRECYAGNHIFCIAITVAVQEIAIPVEESEVPSRNSESGAANSFSCIALLNPPGVPQLWSNSNEVGLAPPLPAPDPSALRTQKIFFAPELQHLQAIDQLSMSQNTASFSTFDDPGTIY
jgi:hypothetical protein